MHGTGRTMIIALIAFAVGLFVGVKFDTNPLVFSERVRLQLDTVTRVVEHQPMYLTRVTATRVDTIKTTDTLIVTPPFVATLDTVVVRDTVRIDYSFPQHTFSLALRRAADSVRVETRTITITETTHEKRPWLMDALTHLGAGVIGYAIASGAK